MTALLALFAILGTPGEDPRSQVVLESDCRTEASHRQLTLFANGTLRLRDGMGATRTMRLVELGSSELEAYLNRLGGIRFDDLAPRSGGLEGDLVESCRVELALPEVDRMEFDYDRFDTLSLGLRNTLLVIDDLVAEFDRVRETESRSRGYVPEIGDIVVRRRDGARFEVLGFTVEGTGVELEGIDQPITIFILRDSVLDEFDPAKDGGDR